MNHLSRLESIFAAKAQEYWAKSKAGPPLTRRYALGRATSYADAVLTLRRLQRVHNKVLEAVFVCEELP